MKNEGNAQAITHFVVPEHKYAETRLVLAIPRDSVCCYKLWQSLKTWTSWYTSGRDSSVGTATRYGLDGPRDRILVRGEIFRTRPDYRLLNVPVASPRKDGQFESES